MSSGRLLITPKATNVRGSGLDLGNSFLLLMLTGLVLIIVLSTFWLGKVSRETGVTSSYTHFTYSIFYSLTCKIL